MVAPQVTILSSNPGLREDLKRSFRDAGYNISFSSGNGQLAIDELSNEGVVSDVFMVDTQLQVGDSFKFIQEVRSMPDFDNSRIYMMASKGELELVKQCIPYGIFGFILKPFSITSLFEQVNADIKLYEDMGRNLKAMASYVLCQVHEAKGDYQKTYDILKTISGHVNNNDLKLRLAMVATYIDKTPEAIKMFNQIIADDSEGYKEKISLFIEKHPLDINLNEDPDKISDHAIRLFNVPLEKFTSKFLGSNKLKKVMVVGGSHDERTNLKNSLLDLGVEKVELSQNGEVALETLRTDFTFNFVVVWLEDDGMNGLEITKNIRLFSQSKRLKVLLVVEESKSGNIRTAINLGADGFCFIPATQDRICQRLHSMMVIEEFSKHSNISQKKIKLAHYFYELEDYEACLSAANEAKVLNPNEGVHCLYSGVAKLYLGKQSEGEHDLKSAFIKNPELSPIIEEIKLRFAKHQEAQKTINLENQKKKKERESKGEYDEDDEVLVFHDGADEGDADTDQTNSPDEKAPGQKKKRRKPRTLVDIQEEDAPQISKDKIKISANKVTASGDEPTASEEDDIDAAYNDNSTPKVESKSKGVQEFAKKSRLESPPPLTQKILEEIGFTESNQVQSQGIEQVLNGNQREKVIEGGQIIQVEDGEVRSWLPTSILTKPKKPKVLNESAGSIIKQWDDTIVPFFDNLNLLSGQAQLLNTRVVCSPRGAKRTKIQKDYLLNVGNALSQCPDIEKKLEECGVDSRYMKTIEAVKEGKASNSDAYRLGYKLIEQGVLDSYMNDAYDYRKLNPSELSIDKLNEISYIADIVDEIAKPLISFHRECKDGEEQFNNDLPYLIEALDKENPDFQPLYKALEIDHFSLESLKKIFAALQKKDDNIALSFYQNLPKDFFNHQRSKRALGKFVMGQGQEKLAKKIFSSSGSKLSHEDLKALSVLAYRQGSYEEALSYCESLVEIRKELEHAYNLMGVLFRKLGNINKAISNYRTGIRLVPESIKLHHNLAIALWKNGDREKSKTYSRKAEFLKHELEKSMMQKGIKKSA